MNRNKIPTATQPSFLEFVDFGWSARNKIVSEGWLENSRQPMDNAAVVDHLRIALRPVSNLFHATTQAVRGQLEADYWKSVQQDCLNVEDEDELCGFLNDLQNMADRLQSVAYEAVQKNIMAQESIAGRTNPANFWQRGLLDDGFLGDYRFPNNAALATIAPFAMGASALVPVMSVDYTLEGEGPNIGKPVILSRLGGCAVRCVGCDTPHSWNVDPSRQSMTVAEFIKRIVLESRVPSGERDSAGYPVLRTRRVSITGGEPLHYRAQMRIIVMALVSMGYDVNIETSGLIFDPVIFAVAGISLDIKTPSSRVRLHDTQLACLYACLDSGFAPNPPDSGVGSYAYAKAIVTNARDREFLSMLFHENLYDLGYARTGLCITPAAEKSYEELDHDALRARMRDIIDWLPPKARLVAQQHKLLNYI